MVFDMEGINKRVLPYKIVAITDNDKQTVVNSLKNGFFCDEPLNASTRLIEENESVTKLENICVNYLQYGLSFMAVTETGEVVGVVLNNIMYRSDVNEYDDNENSTESVKFNKIMSLLDKVQREVDIFAQYPNMDCIMDLKIISVNDAYRGQGVCKALVNKTKELALETGCQMIYVDCSSNFTAKAAERFGFQCIYTLCYLDYVNEHGEVVFETQPPHRYFKVYVLPLQTV